MNVLVDLDMLAKRRQANEHGHASNTSCDVEPVVAIIGPGRSDVSVETARMGKVAELPQLSYWSSSSELDDTKTYPYFGRTIPTDEALTAAACSLWASFNYSIVGCLFDPDDAYSASFNEKLMSACASRRIGVVSIPIEQGNPSSVSTAVDQVADTKISVGVLAVSGSYNLQLILESAVGRHYSSMVSAQTAWSLVDGIGVDEVLQLPSELQPVLHGFLSFSTAGGTIPNPRWKEFVGQRWPWFNASRVNAELPAPFHVADDFFETFNAAASSHVSDIGAF